MANARQFMAARSSAWAKSGGDLPQGYSPVDHIDINSDGFNYVDCGVPFGTYDEINAVMSVNEGGDWKYMFGSDNFEDDCWRTIGIEGKDLGIYDGSNWLDLVDQLIIGDIYNIHSWCDGAYRNWSMIGQSEINGRILIDEFHPISNCHIGTYGGYEDYKAHVSVWMFEIVGKCRLIPCVRDIDLMAGFWDLTQERFVESATSEPLIAVMGTV